MQRKYIKLFSDTGTFWNIKQGKGSMYVGCHGEAILGSQEIDDTDKTEEGLKGEVIEKE